MQELAILMSSLAGAATAVAINKIPRTRVQLQSLGASSQIKNQINSLKIEKEILTKTITRLYQSEGNITSTQRNKLLIKYQHQLGIILAKLEKLESASQHPDLGPIGDGLITLMDQKLSNLDERLYEISSKIVTKSKIQEESTISETRQETPIETIQKQTQKVFENINTIIPKPIEKTTPVFIPPTKSRPSFEIATLTRITKQHNVPPSILKPVEKPIVKEEIKKEVEKPEVEKKKVIYENVETDVKKLQESEIELKITPKEFINRFEKLASQKALPDPKEEKKKSLEQEDLDEEDDLDKIKGEIMKALSKLEQAEVE